MLDSPLAPPWLVITSPQYFKECGLKYIAPPANKKYKYYTSREDAIIRKYYQAIGSRGCVEKLEGRSIQSIVKRARLLKLNHERPDHPHLKVELS